MLSHQQRRLDELAQLAMGELRDSTITIRILVPEVARLIAGPADLERVAEGDILTGRVKHQIHPITYLSTHCLDGGDLLGDRCLAPAVDFERRVPDLA